MFRHESVYVIGEFTSRLSIALTRYDNNPYIDWTFHNNKLYIVTKCLLLMLILYLHNIFYLLKQKTSSF